MKIPEPSDIEDVCYFMRKMQGALVLPGEERKKWTPEAEAIWRRKYALSRLTPLMRFTYEVWADEDPPEAD